MKKSKSKRAMSAVVSAVVLIGITVALAGLIISIVKPFAENQLDESKRCYDLLGGISLNGEYTCYNSSNYTLIVSINQGDVDLEGILIAITEINGTDAEVQRLSNVTGDSYRVPGKESGKKYYFYDIEYLPSSIEIAGVVGGKACDSADANYNILTCSQ